MNEISNGQVIDSMSLEDILSHKDFLHLSKFKSFGSDSDYWEITFESSEFKNGKWKTMFGGNIPSPIYKFYKIKDEN